MQYRRRASRPSAEKVTTQKSSRVLPVVEAAAAARNYQSSPAVRGWASVLSILLLASVGWLDFVTGRDMSFTLF